MLSDAMSEEEIYQAYLLYASLHGWSTDEDAVRHRIEQYKDNAVDETIDTAILAYAEDRVTAPPDVVLDHWGKSRVYQLRQLPDGSWRHEVCDAWFDNGCIYPEEAPLGITHFWTEFLMSAPLPTGFGQGTRLNLKLKSGSVAVEHRVHGTMGELPSILANEVRERAASGIRYLALVDCVSPELSRQTDPFADAAQQLHQSDPEQPEGTVESQGQEDASAEDPVQDDESGQEQASADLDPGQADSDTAELFCKILVSVAPADVSLAELVDHAARAFVADRAKC